MRILLACEESQAVCIEMRKRGHEAYSCDLLPCSGGHPEWHIQGDVLKVINGWFDSNEVFINQNFALKFDPDNDKYEYQGDKNELVRKVGWQWDMMIAFPPCTDLAVSGARWFKEKQADGRQQKSIQFFLDIANAPIERIAIENPVGIMSTHYRKPSQIIHPWNFGDKATKATCLWLKGLPLLKPICFDKPQMEYWYNPDKTRRMEKWMYEIRCKTTKNGLRASLASKTFPGIAKAMAEQWTEDISKRHEKQNY